MNEVFILSAKRTAIGSFLGSLSEISATDLGSFAIKSAVEESKISPENIDEVLMGNVLQASLGQAPTRQSALKAGISQNTPCTTINKVCSSGLKAVMLACQGIKTGDIQTAVAGGMENMSQSPHYYHARKSVKLGHSNMEDGLLKDGLTDSFSQNHMGKLAELCAEKFQITRQEQDEFAINSYQKTARAWQENKFLDEIAPVLIPQKKSDPIVFNKDEEFTNVNFEKIAQLNPVFKKENGTITAANASTINDGAAALVLCSENFSKNHHLKPMAKIISYADAAHQPDFFTTAPAKALEKALEKANLKISDIDFFEFNEAFSVVGLANMKILNINPEKVNIHGGAVSMGHPLGASGARILVTLLHILKQNNARYGAVAICNGGGGASAMIVENLLKS